MRVQNRRFPSVLVGVVLLVFAAFAMPAFASVEDAQREGKVVWYTVLATETAEEIAADFESRYGIEVEVVRDGAAPIFERYNRETAAGIANADVLESTNPGSFVYWQREGMLAPYDTPAAPVFQEIVLGQAVADRAGGFGRQQTNCPLWGVPRVRGHCGT